MFVALLHMSDIMFKEGSAFMLEISKGNVYVDTVGRDCGKLCVALSGGVVSSVDFRVVVSVELDSKVSVFVFNVGNRCVTLSDTIFSSELIETVV